MSGNESTPWVRGDLSIVRSTLNEVEQHALECYPRECCGFISGPSLEPLLLDRAHRETNEADKYHRLDPNRFPRDAHTYFKLNELRAVRAFEEGVRRSQPIKVIYHSHCDAGAHFSEEDAATFSDNATLTWPCAFLVVSVRNGAVEDRKLWVHRPGSDHFDESGLHILEHGRDTTSFT